MESLRDSGAIECGWQLDAYFVRAAFVHWGAARVEVAKSVAAQGGRLTAASTGHDVMASLKHVWPFLGNSAVPPYPPPPG